MIDSKVKEQIQKANLANVVRKVKDGKTLSPRELALVADAPETSTACHRCAFITATELSELADLSVGRISQLVTEGVLVLDSNGKYERAKNVGLLMRWFKSRITGASKDITAIKASKLAKEDELLQIELNKARGEALMRDKVEAAWANIVLVARQKLMGFPNKFAPRVPFLKDQAEAEKELLTEMEEICSELSKPVNYGNQT